MAGSGTTRVTSTDENTIIHTNYWEVDTDPYILDSAKINGELIAQYPRTVTYQASAGIVPNTGTLAYANFAFGPPAVTNDTFASKNPVIVHSTEISVVAGTSSQQITFLRGGLWTINARWVYPNNHSTVNTVTSAVIDLTTNAGGAWIPYARGTTAQPAVAGPAHLSTNASFTYLFPTTGVMSDTRVRFAIASSEAYAGGVTLFVTFTKWRN